MPSYQLVVLEEIGIQMRWKLINEVFLTREEIKTFLNNEGQVFHDSKILPIPEN